MFFKEWSWDLHQNDQRHRFKSPGPTADKPNWNIWGGSRIHMFNKLPSNSQIFRFFCGSGCSYAQWRMARAVWQPPFNDVCVAEFTIILTSPLRSLTFTWLAQAGICIFNAWLKPSGFCAKGVPAASEIADLLTDVSGNLICLIYFSLEKNLS